MRGDDRPPIQVRAIDPLRPAAGQHSRGEITEVRLKSL
jgi:hypothetical protein